MLIEAEVTRNKKSLIVAYLLWLFLGGLGGHDFYTRKIMFGIGKIVLTVLGLACLTAFPPLSLVCFVVLSIWFFLDLFLIPGRIRKIEANTRERLTKQYL